MWIEITGSRYPPPLHLSLHATPDTTMTTVVSKVAVIGSGISGAVCASTLAKNGVSVTLFESARGPGGRMSQRREIAEDGKELLFDHGTPCFSISNNDVLKLVDEWELKGVVAEWKGSFGSFDCLSNKFVSVEQEGLEKRYVGVPGMNSICKALCNENGVESKFGIGVGRLEWLDNENSWLVMGMDGHNYGYFEGVVASDKHIISPRFKDVTGRPPPLDLSLAPELAMKLQDIPVNPCFALMLAFAEPLSSIPVNMVSFKNSELLSWGHCDSSKPGRSNTSERWVLHSTPKYARDVISQTGLQKPSSSTLTKVAEELFQEFKSTGLVGSQAIFSKAHRWSVFGLMALKTLASGHYLLDFIACISIYVGLSQLYVEQVVFGEIATMSTFTLSLNLTYFQAEPAV